LANSRAAAVTLDYLRHPSPERSLSRLSSRSHPPLCDRILITRTDEDVKSLSRELTRDFIANPLIRSRD
jgi:hypothetical protein